MQLARPPIAQHPFHFGRGPLRDIERAAAPASAVSRDLKLFGTTFLAGFVFVSMLIG